MNRSILGVVLTIGFAASSNGLTQEQRGTAKKNRLRASTRPSETPTMRCTPTRLAAAITGALFLLVANPSSQQTTRTRAPGDFNLEELASARSMVDGGVPAWAPDGATIVFLGRSRLWTVSSDGGVPQGLPVEDARSFEYSSDGRWIAYVAGGGNAQEIRLWSVGERRSRQLTDLGARINSWSWSPDSKRIAFSSALKGSFDIYTVQVPGGEVRRVTSDARFDVYPTWAPDGGTILYVRLDDRWVDHDVIAVNAESGAGARTVVEDRDFFDYRVGAEFGPAQVSPRGDLVLFRSHRSGWLNWWVVPLQGGKPRPIAPEQADQNAQKPFRGYARWSPDGRAIAFTSNQNGTHHLRVVDVNGGEPRTLVAPAIGVVANLAWSPDGSRIAFTLDDPRQPMDLRSVKVATGEVTRLTQSLQDPSLERALFPPEKVSYPSTADLTIHAYLYRPPGAAPSRGHPALIWIHGGPTSQFDDSWGRHWEAHYFVKHGYTVLLPNIRGSSGYGRAFEKGNDGCWGRCDMEDVVAGVKYLRTLAGVDADRVAVTGTSYGGFMSIAAATFASGVFQAAVPTRTGYGDWTPDGFALAEVKLLEYELGPFDENREAYRRSSPFYFARDLETPLLLIGGEGDTPMRRFAAEAGRLYKPVRYSGYSGDIDSPENRGRWMVEMLGFLDRHLKRTTF